MGTDELSALPLFAKPLVSVAAEKRDASPDDADG